MGRWLTLGLGTGFRSNTLPLDLLIFWALICSSCSPFSSLQCIPDVSGWMAGWTHIWQGAEAEKKQKWDGRGKKVKRRFNKKTKQDARVSPYLDTLYFSVTIVASKYAHLLNNSDIIEVVLPVLLESVHWIINSVTDAVISPCGHVLYCRKLFWSYDLYYFTFVLRNIVRSAHHRGLKKNQTRPEGLWGWGLCCIVSEPHQEVSADVGLARVHVCSASVEQNWK